MACTAELILGALSTAPFLLTWKLESSYLPLSVQEKII